jgi:hypothetical protein
MNDATPNNTPNAKSGRYSAEEQMALMRQELADLGARFWQTNQELDFQKSRATQEAAARLEERAKRENLQHQIDAMLKVRHKDRGTELTPEMLWDEIERLEMENARLSFELAAARAQVMTNQMSAGSAPAMDQMAQRPLPKPDPSTAPAPALPKTEEKDKPLKALPLPKHENDAKGSSEKTQRVIFKESLFSTITGQIPKPKGN